MEMKEWTQKVCAVTIICALGGIFGGAASRLSIEVLENGKEMNADRPEKTVDWPQVQADAAKAGHALGWFGLIWAPLALSGVLSGRKGPSP